MPNDEFGFGAQKKTSLDLSGVLKGSPDVTSERKAAEVERGATMGFERREAVVPLGEGVSSL